ncbi:40890_t:CDS:2, partial [Gigaspora margarita]
IKSETEKEAETTPKRDLIATTEMEPTITTLSRKVMLELLECGTTNYGTDEVQKQIIDQRLKQTNEIEELVKNRHKEVTTKETNNSLVQKEKNSIKISFGPDSRSLKESINEINPKETNIYNSIWVPKSEKTPSTMSQKREIYNFILWNIPKEVQGNKIRRCFNFYGKATILTARATSRIEALQKAWAIHFEEEKTVCISSGEFDSDTIQERKKFRAIIKNLPKDALKLSMLKQFKNINAQMVFIPENSNRN